MTMTWIDIIVVVIIALLLFLAVRMWKRVKKKGCGGNCASCRADCSRKNTRS